METFGDEQPDQLSRGDLQKLAPRELCVFVRVNVDMVSKACFFGTHLHVVRIVVVHDEWIWISCDILARAYFSISNPLLLEGVPARARCLKRLGRYVA